MINDDHVLISVSKEHMSNKNYEPSVVVLANELGYVDEENQHRCISRAQLIAQMKSVLKLSKYKCGIILDVFVESGLIKQGDTKDELYLNLIQHSFLKLLMTTARYCLEHLSNNEFKIYCYLFNKYNMHIYYQHTENYFFSEKEVAEAIGYKGRNPNTVRMIKESLLTLRELGLIDYDLESIGRPGKHGTYHELYCVRDYSPVQTEALQQTIDECKQLPDELVRDAVVLGSDLSAAELTESQQQYLEEVRNNGIVWRLD